jgi:hypothetical protein
LVEHIIKKKNNVAWNLKDQRWFFLCVFRTLPGLNFAVVENCTFRNVEGPVPFHSSEGTDSVIYLLHICIVCHILSVLVFT